MGNTSSKEYPDINSFAHYIHTDSRKPLDFDSPAAHRNILLPKYYNTEHIPTLRLVLAEPALPLVDSFRKARLILFETARLNKPRYAVLESKETVALLGDAREVDLQLVRFERHIDGEKLYFGPEKKKAEKLLEELNTKVMENSAMVCAVDGAKATIIRLDRTFQDKAIMSLKRALIERCMIDHASLAELAQDLAEQTFHTIAQLDKLWLEMAIRMTADQSEERACLLTYCQSDIRYKTLLAEI